MNVKVIGCEPTFNGQTSFANTSLFCQWLQWFIFTSWFHYCSTTTCRNSVFILENLYCAFLCVDDGLKWVQAEPGARGQHLCCQVQSQHSPVPAGFVVGLHGPSFWRRDQHHADEVPTHSSSSWLCFLCRSLICWGFSLPGQHIENEFTWSFWLLISRIQHILGVEVWMHN